MWAVRSHTPLLFLKDGIGSRPDEFKPSFETLLLLLIMHFSYVPIFCEWFFHIYPFLELLSRKQFRVECVAWPSSCSFKLFQIAFLNHVFVATTKET
jgi:hypothetical protein